MEKVEGPAVYDNIDVNITQYIFNDPNCHTSMTEVVSSREAFQLCQARRLPWGWWGGLAGGWG